MNIKDILEKLKTAISAKQNQFKNLNKSKKIAIIIAIISIIVAGIFGIDYMAKNKYGVLFSGLDSNDAATITKELESKKVETKIEGNSILVPKEQVDKLRLELSQNISNGSKGFEIMDEGSSFGMTDEEFKIKKQMMIQGEIEKTIKTFPQIANARVHITNGQTSVFAEESIPGQAAVSIELKPGENLDSEQVRSIISLVSASTQNIPKQNVEVVDQNMNLLSEGLFDENGKIASSDSNGVTGARKAEKDLNHDLERAIISLLEPIFGPGKVKATVNSDLNFDASETIETKIDPNKVIVSESKSESSSTEQTNTGGAIDNNMNNISEKNGDKVQNKEQKTEYEVGKIEKKVIKAQGEINKITASVAIDANLDDGTMRDVKSMVANTIGLNKDRGDDVAVVAMKFGMDSYNSKDSINDKKASGMDNVFKITMYIVGFLLVLIVIAIISMVIFKKKEKAKLTKLAAEEEDEIDLINKKLEEMEKNRLIEQDQDEESVTLEEEVRSYATENPDQVTELINSWLNE